jgi:hypothetical protein
MEFQLFNLIAHMFYVNLFSTIALLSMCKDSLLSQNSVLCTGMNAEHSQVASFH